MSIDYRGVKFGRLTVTASAEYSRTGRRRVWAACACGSAERKVYLHHLMDGHTRSCGCLAREAASVRIGKQSTKHGHGKQGEWTLTYNSWRSMHKRCLDPRHRSYRAYGGRGIHICDEWQGEDGFKNFLADMGERPSVWHTLDRINVEGHYEKANCRWATDSEQRANKRPIFIRQDSRGEE